jgi:hypothetical protein
MTLRRLIGPFRELKIRLIHLTQQRCESVFAFSTAFPGLVPLRPLNSFLRRSAKDVAYRRTSGPILLARRELTAVV